jgi:hypothetical protein
MYLICYVLKAVLSTTTGEMRENSVRTCKLRQEGPNDRIVSIGDAQADVMMKCGGPTLQDSREENIIERIDTDVRIKRTIIIDEWTYNLGPDSLTRTLRFENGELVDIQTGNYGY